MPQRNMQQAQSSSSFRGMPASQIRRPRTVPDLVSYGSLAATSPEDRPRVPPKLLLNVTMQGSPGPVQVVMKPESTVGDLVASAVRQYVKEGRRPVLPTANPSAFDLHYSQFSLESLDKEEKLVELGSRNFFLCPKKCSIACGGTDNGGGATTTTSFASCSKEVGKVTKNGGFGWFNLKLMMDFMM